MPGLEIGNGHSVTRRFGDRDELPAPWDDNRKTMKVSDEYIFQYDAQEKRIKGQPSYQTVEGVGFVMLAKTTDVTPLQQAA